MADQDLTTLAKVKEYLELDSSDTTYDTLLSHLITAASDFIQSYCNRWFNEKSYSKEEYDGTGDSRLNLKQYPVSSSSSFTLEKNQAVDNSDNWTTYDGKDYWIHYDEGIVELYADIFTKAPRKYRVSYTAGYSSVPVDLEWACWKIVSAIFNKRKAEGISQESLGDYSVHFMDIIQEDKTLKEVLNRYRNINL